MTSAGGAGRRPRSSQASARLRRLIEQALVDACGEDEQHGAFLVMVRSTHRVSVTALQWAGRRPAGAEWLDAYRAWLKGTNGT